MSEYFNSRIPIFLQLGLREAAVPKLKTYLDQLWSTNEDLNLISRKMTVEDLVDNHVIDCLLPLEHFPRHVQQAADLGSGGGLPGLIYAIQFPHVHFHLYEKSPKKQEFLNSFKSLIKNFEVHGEVPPKLQNIDLVVARGFKPVDVILEITRDYFNNGGKYFLLKARAEKIQEELSEAKRKFKKLDAQIIKLASPVLEVERHLVII